MSITFTIQDNREYCLENDLARTDWLDCNCDKNPKCYECGGLGKFKIETLPFELNIANGNFDSFMRGWRCGLENCGSMDGRKLLWLLDQVQQERCTRAASQRDRYIDFGLSDEQVSRYLGVLSEIANEAIRRESPVVWG